MIMLYVYAIHYIHADISFSLVNTKLSKSSCKNKRSEKYQLSFWHFYYVV